jgi:NAD(P)-dependent dehydrogenase (short-subunit alcohol dehydrogenase family)
MNRPELSLENRSALITGASGGIGGAIARAFAAAGAKLFLHGTSEEKLKSLLDELKAEGFASGAKAIALATPGDARQLVDAALADMGRIDVLVNSAGINRPQKSVDVTETNWDDVLNINLKMLFFVSQAAGKEMIKQGGGKIIHISSQAGLIALPLRAAYCSSKGGVNQLTRTLACEWAPHHINVNAVAPTFVRTPFTEKMLEDEEFKKYVIDSIPLGRMATTDEIAYATLFLASDLANMITGHILTVDGGWTIK